MKALSAAYTPLYLPSAIVNKFTCMNRLIEAKWRFRYAQASTVLNDLRASLLLRSRLYKSKNMYSHGNAQNTRSMSSIKKTEKMIQAAASKYRLNREAMITLSPFLTEQDCSWMMVYKDLLDEDVIGLSSMDDSSSEGRKKLSWIWKVEGAGASANEATEEGMLLF